MIGIAIALLWVLIIAVLVAGVLYFIIRAIKRFAPTVIDGNIENGIWLIYLALVLIYALLAISGHAPTLAWNG